MLDLTQTIDKGIPDWDGSCGFQMRQVMGYLDGACVQELKMPNGIGTHMDAPSHFIEAGQDIASMEVGQLICPGVVIDVSMKADQNYTLNINDIIAIEAQHGAVPEKSIVIIHTGWGRKWDDAIQYRNEDAQGLMCFPKVSLEAAELLLERKVNGIAIDTLSPDWPDSDYPVHHALLGAGKFIIENIRVVDALPTVGFTVVALPIKIKFATEAPCRVVAIVEK